MLKLILLATILLAIAMIFIGIKMFLSKDGQFTKTCASVDMENGKRSDCVCSGNGDDSNCKYYAEHHPGKS